MHEVVVLALTALDEVVEHLVAHLLGQDAPVLRAVVARGGMFETGWTVNAPRLAGDGRTWLQFMSEGLRFHNSLADMIGIWVR